MGKIVARNASLGVDDSTGACRAMSALASNIKLTWSAEAPEVTSFGQNNKERLPNGIQDWELTADMFWSSGANEVDAVMAGIGPSGSTRIIFGPSGSTSTCIMYSACAVLTKYDMTFSLAGAAQASITFTGRSGSLTRGTWA